MINMVYAPYLVQWVHEVQMWIGSVKYCGLYSCNEGGADGRADGRTAGTGHDNTRGKDYFVSIKWYPWNILHCQMK